MAWATPPSSSSLLLLPLPEEDVSSPSYDDDRHMPPLTLVRPTVSCDGG